MSEFSVETGLLRRQARLWADRKTDCETVNTATCQAVDSGYKFGVLAGSEGVEEMFNTWTNAMQDALEDAGLSFGYFDKALSSTADAYDASDATSAMDLHQLDKLLDEGDYHV